MKIKMTKRQAQAEINRMHSVCNPANMTSAQIARFMARVATLDQIRGGGK